MKLMLQRVDAMAVAKHSAVVYGVFTTALTLLMMPMLLLGLLMGHGTQSGMAFAFPLALMILYPILGLVCGWIFGWVAGVVFNFAAPRIGGLRFEAAEEPAAAPVVA